MKFGRTNLELPKVWLSLQTPDEPTTPYWAEELIETALAAKVPMDMSGSPAFWGGLLRHREATTVSFGGLEVRRAPDAIHAAAAVYSHVIQTVSCYGRGYVDFYFIRVRGGLRPDQAEGAVKGLQEARDEGLVRFGGLAVEGPGSASLELFDQYDVFDAVVAPRNPVDHDAFDAFRPAAERRGVGLATSHPLNWGLGVPFTVLPNLWRKVSQDAFPGYTAAQAVIATYSDEHPVLVGVRSVREIDKAIEAGMLRPVERLDDIMRPVVELYLGEEEWIALQDDPRVWVRKAAARRLGGA